MKYCPNCGANVEGLLYHCDCCSEPLTAKKCLFKYVVYDLPQCLGFSSLVDEFIRMIEPTKPEIYHTFLDEVIISISCYPEWIHNTSAYKKRQHINYSSKKKTANIRLSVDYLEFIHANKSQKKLLIAETISFGIYWLQSRLKKNGLSIDEVVLNVEKAVNSFKKIKNEKKLNCTSIVDSRLLFITQNCPEYIGGADVEKTNILFDIYDALPSNTTIEDKKARFKKTIHEIFKSNNEHFPNWIDGANWPIQNGQPMCFVSQTDKVFIEEKNAFRIDYTFEDMKTGIQKIITQYR